MHSPHVFKSTSTATSTSTTTTVTFSGISQPGSVAGRRQQGSFVGLSANLHAPESTRISSTYYQRDEPRLLSDVSVSDISALQTDPLDARTIHITVTFGDDHQGRSASSLSLSNEPTRSQKLSQPVGDLAPIIREEPSPDPTNKLIVMSGDKKKPFQCGYRGCGKKYSIKAHLQTHFVTHTGDSKLRCYLGDCAGTAIYRDTQALTRHMHSHHTFERMYGCKLCSRRFRQQHHLKYHIKHVHTTEEKKQLPKPQSVSKSSSITSSTHTVGTSMMTSRVSQPESAAGQRQQGSFVDLWKTVVHTPESTHIPVADRQFSGLRLLAEVSTSQIDPFQALATHQTVSFDDEAVTTGMAGVPNLPIFQYLTKRSPDPTDTNAWIIVDKSQERPYICGFPECDKNYKYRSHLIGHFIAHTGVSKFECTYPKCVGKRYFRDRSMLNRHIICVHTLAKPFQCNICERRFGLREYLVRHSKNIHLKKMRKNHHNERTNNYKLKNLYNSG